MRLRPVIDNKGIRKVSITEVFLLREYIKNYIFDSNLFNKLHRKISRKF